jgi:hypothetical protein
LTYPDLGDNWIAHSCIAAAILKKRANGFVDFYRKPIREIQEIFKAIRLQSDGDIYISSEHFSSRLNLDEISYFKFELDKAFKDYNVKIVCSIRDPLGFFYSSYSTHIKSGGRMTVDTYYKKAVSGDRYFNQLLILDEWSKVFGVENIAIKDYDSDKFKSNPVSALLPFSVPFDSSKRSNISLKDMTIKLGHVINGSEAYTLRQVDEMLPDVKYNLLTLDQERCLRSTVPSKMEVINYFGLDVEDFTQLEPSYNIYLSEEVLLDGLMQSLVKKR